MMQDEKAESFRDGAWAPPIEKSESAKTLGKQARKRIGTHLRAMYDSVVQQPIPNRFTDLIAQLDDTPASADVNEA